MRTFVIGDIHGALKALKQCLERSGFSYSQDRLIVLGDVCDGYPEVCGCIDELLMIRYCDYIIGNHDLWTLEWAQSGKKERAWISQGGLATINSYDNETPPQEHIHFLQKAHLWLLLENKVFVHGGFDPNFPIEKQARDKFVWDRELITNAWKHSKEGNDFKFSIYEEIFLGHTPVQNFQSHLPLHLGNVWALDTGAGWRGKLTIMDIHTKEYWQSDPTPDLYGGVQGRK